MAYSYPNINIAAAIPTTTLKLDSLVTLPVAPPVSGVGAEEFDVETGTCGTQVQSHTLPDMAIVDLVTRGTLVVSAQENIVPEMVV